ncbi:MAG: ribosome recycling factor [Xanthomonadaceae bacterium]|nr:ribosome recycling factor [Xanthomonadaceae bacterium]
MSKQIIDSMSLTMDKSIQSLQKDLVKMRTGRASAGLVEPVHVDYYGSSVPLSQVANITTPDARTIQIVAWEQSMCAAIEKAILAANIGVTPQNDGKVIRISMPALTEDRRKEMAKQIKKMGEDAKVAIRNVRREGNEEVKKQEKAKVLSEDEAKKVTDQVQKKTDEKIAEVDKIISAKEKEVLTL